MRRELLALIAILLLSVYLVFLAQQPTSPPVPIQTYSVQTLPAATIGAAPSLPIVGPSPSVSSSASPTPSATPSATSSLISSPGPSPSVAPDTTPPVVAVPQVLLPVPGLINSKNSLNLRVNARAQDEDGISLLVLEQSETEGKYHTLAYASAAFLTTEYMQHSRRSFILRAQALDNVGNTSAWTSTEALTLIDYQIDDPHLNYAGTWNRVLDARFWGGGAQRSNSAGATVTLTTIGSDFGIVAVQGPDQGRFAVFVDGQAAGTVDLYAPTTGYRYLAWSQHLDTSAAHSVELRVLGDANSAASGTWVEFDNFVTIGPATEPLPSGNGPG